MKGNVILATVLVIIIICPYLIAQNESIESLQEKMKAQEQRIQELERTLNMLEGKEGGYGKEIGKEYITSPEATEKMTLTAGYDNGFFVRTPDSSVEFKFTGWLKVNAAFFEDDTINPVDIDGVTGYPWDSSAGAAADRFYISQARLYFHLYFYKNWHAVICLDPPAGAVNNILQDAYIEYNGWDYAHIRAGQFVLPFSIEAQEPPQDLLTINYSSIMLGAATTNREIRDIGLMVYGYAFDYIGYAAAITNGSGRNRFDENDDFCYSAQFRVHPFTTAQKRSFIHVAAMMNRTGPRAGGARLATPWGWEVFDAASRIGTGAAEDGWTIISEADRTCGWTYGVSAGYSLVKDDFPFRTQGEFIWKEFARDRITLQDATGVRYSRRAPRLNMYGFWIQFSYFIQITDDKYTGIEPLLKIEYADVDDEESEYPHSLVIHDHDQVAGLGEAFDVRGQDLWCFTLGVRCHLNKHIRLDFNWLMAKPEITEHVGPNLGDEWGSISDKIDHNGGLMHAFMFQLQAKW